MQGVRYDNQRLAATLENLLALDERSTWGMHEFAATLYSATDPKARHHRERYAAFKKRLRKK